MTTGSDAEGAEGKRSRLIRSHRELDVYRRAFTAGMGVFEVSKRFPSVERHGLTDQVRRSSRSVCANIAEGWRKRRYRRAFVKSLNDAEAEAGETQVWLEFAAACGYLTEDEAVRLYAVYDGLCRSIVGMILHADRWYLPPS